MVPRLYLAAAAAVLAALLGWTAYPWFDAFLGTCSGRDALWPSAARQSAVVAIGVITVLAAVAAAFVALRASRSDPSRRDLVLIGLALAILLVDLVVQPVDRLGVDAAYACLTAN